MKNKLSVIAGLGNPGSRYKDTLHNVGFTCVDEIASYYGGAFSYEAKFDTEITRVTISEQDIWLVKPQSFMNKSGGPIRAVLNYYQIPTEHVLIVHDEIDLATETLKLKIAGGHGGHNGLRDIISHCDNQFLRLRIGVGHPGHKDEVINYVLRKVTKEQEIALHQNIDQALKIIPILIEEGVESAMKKLHTEDDLSKNGD